VSTIDAAATPLLEHVRRALPDLAVTSAWLRSGEGQFNHVLVVNEQLIFRFPRAAGCRHARGRGDAAAAAAGPAATRDPEPRLPSHGPCDGGAQRDGLRDAPRRAARGRGARRDWRRDGARPHGRRAGRVPAGASQPPARGVCARDSCSGSGRVLAPAAPGVPGRAVPVHEAGRLARPTSCLRRSSTTSASTHRHRCSSTATSAVPTSSPTPPAWRSRA
jgi:hypothetical protein